MANPGTVYSKALYNALGDSETVSKALENLREFSDLIKASLPLQRALYSSLIDVQSRISIVEILTEKMNYKGVIKNFLIILAKNNRIADLPEIIFSLNKLVHQNSGVVEARLRSAVQMSAVEVSNLGNVISHKLGKTVELTQSEDPELLGGFVVEADGTTFDASLKTQLENLKEICTV